MHSTHILRKNAINILALVFLFVVVLVGNSVWFSNTLARPWGDGIVHFKNSTVLYEYLEKGDLERFFLPENRDHYPPLLYQMCALLFLTVGKSFNTAYLLQISFGLILIFAINGIGKELWNEETGFLAGIIAFSNPYLLGVSRNYMLDIPTSAMIALCVYLFIRSDEFGKPGWTVGFFVCLGIAMLIKWTSFFILLGLILAGISRAVFSKMKRKGKIEMAVGFIALACLFLIMLYWRLEVHSDVVYTWCFYLLSISPVVLFLGIAALLPFQSNAAKGIIMGIPAFLITCWHFYFPKFINLAGGYVEQASGGVGRETYSIGVFFHKFIFEFPGLITTILLITGLAVYLFSKKTILQKDVLIGGAGALLVLLLHGDRHARYLFPLLAFIAPLCVLWISKIQRQRAKNIAVALLMLVVFFNVSGWTYLMEKSFVDPGPHVKTVLARFFNNPPPRLISKEQKARLLSLGNSLGKSLKGRDVILIPAGAIFKERAVINEEDLTWAIQIKHGILPIAKRFSGDVTQFKYKYSELLYSRNPWRLTPVILRTVARPPDGETYMFSQNGGVFRYHQNNTWRIKSPINSRLNDSWASEQGAVYAVGDKGAFVKIENGRIQKVKTGVNTNLNAVWGVRDEVYAVGHAGVMLMYKNDVVEKIKPPDKLDFTSIWLNDSDNIYVTAGGDIYRYNKGKWMRIPCDNSHKLNGITGLPDGNVYVAGNAGTIIEIRKGKCFAMSSGTNEDLHSIWNSPDGAVYTVGDIGTFLRLRKGKWAKIKSGVNFEMTDIYGSKERIFIVGKNASFLTYNGRSTPVQKLINHWDVERCILVYFYRPGQGNVPRSYFMSGRIFDYSNHRVKFVDLPDIGYSVMIIEMEK